MAVRIVTDSTADLDRDEAQQLGIEVVPLNVHFGETTYRDGIDLSADRLLRAAPDRCAVTSHQRAGPRRVPGGVRASGGLTRLSALHYDF